ncbi:DUF4190 domain-containing protein [uncultured Microbacterium sp.]|uniref:DUF4190 domain-containing protein n=1 Tax=uncultured Microbacterium sp. TaxID=191216 RepID=UPI0028D2E6E7|nr:DUF4190 domain-containing protein [uncultured Microbacterium sp.]
MTDPNNDGSTPVPPPAPPAYDAPPPAAGYGAPQPPAYGSAPAYGQAPPAYGASPAYGSAPGYAAPYGAYAPVKTNTLAIISLVASIVGFIWILPFIGSLAGVIMGHISLRQIAANGEKGRGMALAGLIVGYAGLALFVIGVIAFIAFFAFAASQGVSYSS